MNEDTNIYKIPVHARFLATGELGAPHQEFVAVDKVGFSLRYFEKDEDEIYDEDGNLREDYLRKYMMCCDTIEVLVEAENLEEAIDKYRDDAPGFDTYPEERRHEREARAAYIDTYDFRPIKEYPVCHHLNKEDGRYYCGEMGSPPLCTMEGNDPPPGSTGEPEHEMCPFQVYEYFEKAEDSTKKREITSHGFTNRFDFVSLVDIWDDKFIAGEEDDDEESAGENREDEQRQL